MYLFLTWSRVKCKINRGSIIGSAEKNTICSDISVKHLCHCHTTVEVPCVIMRGVFDLSLFWFRLQPLKSTEILPYIGKRTRRIWNGPLSFNVTFIYVRIPNAPIHRMQFMQIGYTTNGFQALVDQGCN